MEHAASTIIVDCDAGIDDALALIMLIGAHKAGKLNLIAVTCVNGNTTVDNVVQNVCRTMNTCGISEIPVYKGAFSPLLNSESATEAILEQHHGQDGFADVFAKKSDTSQLRNNHAAYALNRITLANPGEVTVVCLGPLTNIALTTKLYPDFLNNVKDLFVMGGNSTAQGNITSQAEFNFYTDPESAHIVFNNIEKPLWLLPWECCLKSRVTYDWRKNVLGQINVPAIRMLNKLENSRAAHENKQWHYYVSCDAILAAIVLKPDTAKNVTQWNVDVELEGKRTRGQVVLDHLHILKPNVNLIEDFDSEIFKQLLLDMTRASCSSIFV